MRKRGRKSIRRRGRERGGEREGNEGRHGEMQNDRRKRRQKE